MSRVIYVGERHILEAEFKNNERSPISVSEGVVVYILPPNAPNAEGPLAATRTATGIYRYDYYPQKPGIYKYQFQTPSGTVVADKSFTVKKSVFDSLPPFPDLVVVADTPSIIYVGVDGDTPENIATTPSFAYVGVDAITPPTIGVADTPSYAYAAQDATGVNQIQDGDVFFIQTGAPEDATLDDNVIGLQKRTSYPDGPLDPDDIQLILSWDSEDWTPRHLRIDEENFKLVFSAQDNLQPAQWYLYTCNFNGSGLTRIYTAPLDTTAFREFDITGLYVNNRSNIDPDQKIMVGIDGTYALVFRGRLISMDIDGNNQVTQQDNKRNGSDLSGSDRDNRMFWDVDDAGFDNFVSDPFAYSCDSHASTIPANSISGAYNGRGNFIYNLDAFGVIRRAAVSCVPTTPFDTWVASHPSAASFNDLNYSDLTDEVLVGGAPARVYDAGTPSTFYNVGVNSTQATTTSVVSVSIFQGGEYQV